MLRVLVLLLTIVAVAGCSRSGRDLDKPPVPLGDFRLGHNVVIAPKAVQGPLSRKVTKEELATSLKQAIGDRFERYEGDGLYHFGVSVEGYVLAIPGVPVVYNPKSIMIINLTVWDDAAGKKLNEEPVQLTVFESLTGETVLSSGLTQTKEEQLENLSINAAKQIEIFLKRQVDGAGWFAPEDAVAAAE